MSFEVPLQKEKTPEEKTFERYQEYFALSPEDLSKNILDIGAAGGKFIKYVREDLGNKNAYAVEKSKQKLDDTQEGFIVADGASLPFEDESFEIVLGKNYFPMFVDEPDKMQQILKEALRVLKKDGKLLGDMATPEFEKNSGEEFFRTNPPHMIDQKTEEWFEKRYQGSLQFQEFLNQLEKEGYQISVINNGRKVIQIKK
jgi:ubiquinone/menaquinone biosynthesis C-methylase UbiE